MAGKEKSGGHFKLGEWFATAICGNDILSSALYVSGIAAIFAGVYAPIVLAVIALVLFCYKAVYTEVVEALPINGGAYNGLLNGTSKSVAAIAGVTTVLSYVATAVISATIAVEYVHTILPVSVIPITIVLLGLFAVLVISGLKDSAKVAFGIFVIHTIALSLFVIFGLVYFVNGHSYFMENLSLTTNNIIGNNGIYKQLFLAFAASLLGVSGFESSANFVEEQKRGVFRKTLRNMLIGVAIFNPLIALVALNSSPLGVIISAKEFLLASEALIIGGRYFQYFIVADAFLVLSGAVLTSYIGVSGLIYRMASDACLPGFLTAKNNKGSYWKIVLTFFLLCTSILLITKGSLLSLAGVYTIAFLSVMSLFAVGNLILRFTRADLKRTYYAPLPMIVFAFFATVVGIIGNILIDWQNLIFFLMYFIPAVLLVHLIVYQDYYMRIFLKLTKNTLPLIHKYLLNKFEDITDGKVIVFVNHANRLFRILSYVNTNETARNIILIHCKNHDGSNDFKRFEEIKKIVPVLEAAGVFPHLNVEFHYEDQPFGPEAVENVSKKFKVHKNRIMIGSIHKFHEFEYPELGGVRIII